MQIIWKGQSCFQIAISQGKDNQLLLVIDPFDASCGLKVPNLSGDILLVSHNHPDHNNVKSVSGQPFLIEGPGEYEIKGVYIQGIPAFDKSNGRTTIYIIEAEEIKICHLGGFGQKELFAEQLEDIGEVDVLLIPIGNAAEGPEGTQKIIGQIEPKIIIPMHYSLPKLKAKSVSLDKFLKVMGEKNQEPIAKLSLKRKDLSTEEETKIIVLRP